MISAWSVAAIRQAEQIVLTSTPEGSLMQRAAAAVATVAAQQLRERHHGVSGRKVLLLIGSGNNGGDALFAGAALARRGARVGALLLAEPGHVHADGLRALRAAGGRVLTTDPEGRPEMPGPPDLVIDGIVGLAGAGGLRPGAVRAAASIGEAIVVSVDLPSGLDPDSGDLPAADSDGRDRHIRADVTVSFGQRTPCLLLPPAALAAGDVIDVDLGFRIADPPPICRLETADVAALWPWPRAASHKYTRGVLGVVAGSNRYPGAAVLVSGGAVRTGAAGAVRFLGSEAVTSRVLSAWPEVMPGPGRVEAWVCGPGIPPAPENTQDDGGEAHRHRELVHHAVGSGLPTVADAGALAMLPPRCGPQVVLTPHAGELAALLTARGETTNREDVEAEPLRCARRAVALTGATVLLKGPVTMIVGPSGPIFTQAEATPWLATAGAGDVLAGVLGSLLAAGLPVAEAAAAAASLHGRAARRAAERGPIIASDVIAALPGAIAALIPV